MSKYMKDKLCWTKCPYYAPTGSKARTRFGMYRAWVRRTMAEDGDVCYWMGLNVPATAGRKPEEEK